MGSQAGTEAALAVEPPPPEAAPAAAAAAAAAPATAALPGFEDPELDAAALALEQHALTLRSDLLGRLLDWRRRAGEAHAAQLAATAHAAAQQLAGVREELQRAAADAARLREVVKRMGIALLKARLWRRHRRLAYRVWRAWRDHAHRKHRAKAMLEAAVRHYEVGWLRRKVLAAWRLAAAAQLRGKRKAQAAAMAELERQRQEEAAAAAQQKQRLAEVEAALEAALAGRAQLEQQMRRAFMRGVCALNLEAMSLLKPGEAGAIESQPAGQQEEEEEQQQQQQQQERAGGGEAAGGLPAWPPAVDEPAAAWLQQAAGGAPALVPAAHAAYEGRWSIAAAGTPAASSTLWLKRLAAEAPRSPAQPVPAAAAAAAPPSWSTPAVLRHTGVASSLGSQTAVRTAAAAAPLACSLPSNVPPHVAAALSGPRSGRAVRPTTAPAPARRQAPAALAAPLASGSTQRQVSRRSLAAQQQHSAAAGAANGGKPLVMRGATAGDQEAVAGRWQR